MVHVQQGVNEAGLGVTEQAQRPELQFSRTLSWFLLQTDLGVALPPELKFR